MDISLELKTLNYKLPVYSSDNLGNWAPVYLSCSNIPITAGWLQLLCIGCKGWSLFVCYVSLSTIETAVPEITQMPQML